MEINLGDYSWEEVQELVKSDPVVVLPVGAFEQHGKHLPLKVDEFMVSSISRDSVKKAQKKHKSSYCASCVDWIFSSSYGFSRDNFNRRSDFD